MNAAEKKEALKEIWDCATRIVTTVERIEKSPDTAKELRLSNILLDNAEITKLVGQLIRP